MTTPAETKKEMTKFEDGVRLCVFVVLFTAGLLWSPAEAWNQFPRVLAAPFIVFVVCAYVVGVAKAAAWVAELPYSLKKVRGEKSN